MMTHLTTLKTLPLLDLSQLDGDARRRRALTICARRPATSVFYLRGHGVDSALNARLQQGARQFSRCRRPTNWRCRWCIRRTFAVTTGRRRS